MDLVRVNDFVKPTAQSPSPGLGLEQPPSQHCAMGPTSSALLGRAIPIGRLGHARPGRYGGGAAGGELAGARGRSGGM